MSSGGVPNTVARRPAESERPMADPETGADSEIGADLETVCGGEVSPGCAAKAVAAVRINANGISFRRVLIVIRIFVTIAATACSITVHRA